MKTCREGFRAVITEQHTSGMKEMEEEDRNVVGSTAGQRLSSYSPSNTRTHTPWGHAAQHVSVCLCADIPNEHLLVALAQREKRTWREAKAAQYTVLEYIQCLCINLGFIFSTEKKRGREIKQEEEGGGRGGVSRVKDGGEEKGG